MNRSFIICLVVAGFWNFASCSSQSTTAQPDTGSIEFTYTNSLDGSQQKAAAFIPASAINKETPLIAVAHYWGGDRFMAKGSGYYAECEKRGWICVCPQLHGNKTDNVSSLASRESQHDIIDAIAYISKKYKVDAAHIYCAGRSMGGMTAQIMAALYPDVFAAVVAGQGISNLADWTTVVSDEFKTGIEKECGKYTKTSSFNYMRRSSVSYGPNFAYVPIILWHGTNDKIVPVTQTKKLYETISAYTQFPPPVYWLAGASHCEQNYTAVWECEQLSYYSNSGDCGQDTKGRFYDSLHIITDQSKPFFWLTLVQRDTTRFSEIMAKLSQDNLFVNATNLRSVTVDRSKIPVSYRLSGFSATADSVMQLLFIYKDIKKTSVTVEKTTQGVLPAVK